MRFRKRAITSVTFIAAQVELFELSEKTENAGIPPELKAVPETG